MDPNKQGPRAGKGPNEQQKAWVRKHVTRLPESPEVRPEPEPARVAPQAAEGGTEPGPQGKETGTAGDRAAEYQARLVEWSPAIMAAMTGQGPAAADIARLFAQATALSRPGGDMAKALARLTRCHALATRGAALSAGGAARAAPREPLLPIWVKAKDAVDAEISKLQDKLRAADDEDLNAVVEFGLHGATTGQAVKLMAALREADAQGSPTSMRKVVAAAAAFRDFLGGAPIVNLIENNPFGVNVPLRKTLGAALDRLVSLARG
jgi:hypothetical protein